MLVGALSALNRVQTIRCQYRCRVGNYAENVPNGLIAIAKVKQINTSSTIVKLKLLLKLTWSADGELF